MCADFLLLFFVLLATERGLLGLKKKKKSRMPEIQSRAPHFAHVSRDYMSHVRVGVTKAPNSLCSCFCMETRRAVTLDGL